MFYVRLNKLRIIKNGDLIGKGEIQFMSFINQSSDSFPNLNEFFETNDENRKKEIIKDSVSQVIQSRILMTIYKVKDKSIITFGDTGYIVYKDDKIPQDFSWQIVGVELDKKMRDNAALIKAILTDSNINVLTKGIEALAKTTNPVSGAVVELSKLVVGVILDIAKNKKDDQVGYYLSSFIEKLDYPNGIRDKQDVPDLTGNMFVDYSIFGYLDYATKGVEAQKN
ncbi:hypothetical protein [Flavobacterium sharifuzzamanii]|uniref:hypothetical protein n=1 Tax=Flavobacterium sharifuzzamanii TaxID=2211133 RepID=UPI000DACCEEE|nr:hypothetical protein [Flavobacterium sharifuzzamanii]KAF2081224.1 hypothetical protein DMA14_09475 [Flavobacterium sharifuzzamanii]